MKRYRLLPFLILSCFFLNGCLTAAIRDAFREGEHEEIRRLQHAVELNPDNVHAWFMLGKSYLGIEKPKQAGKCFQEAINRQPGFEEAYLGLGVSEFERRRWKAGRRVYESLLAHKPESALAYQGMALGSLKEGDLPSAEAAAKKAIELRPEDSQGHRLLGEIHYIRGDYDAAVEEWDLAVEGGKQVGSVQPLLSDLEQYLRKYP